MSASQRQSALARASKFDAWIWRRIAETDLEPTLPASYHKFRTPDGNQPLTVSTVVSATDPLVAVTARTGRWKSWHARAGRVGAMLVTSDDEESFVVTSWPDDRAQIFHVAATVPATDRRWRRFHAWLSHCAPHVMPIYLDRREFEDFVSVLSEYGDVDASRLTGRYRADQSSYSRGWPNPKGARSALEEVADDVQLRTMTLSVLTTEDSDVALRVHLRRVAGATFYSGDFKLFSSIVLDRLASAASKRVQLFQNRERTLENPSVRPVDIRVGRPRFSEPESLTDLIDRVSRYSSSDTAVLHRNPYLQLALTDYLDGSNFDIFVTSDDRIRIYPGYRASISGLVRLTDFLSEELEADGVADSDPLQAVAMEDLFSSDR